MKKIKNRKLFSIILTLFLALGVGPTLLIAISAVPFHQQLGSYKMIIGFLLILSTICTLSLAGLVTRLLKHPLNQLLFAQKQIRHGNLSYRLPTERNEELNTLFNGFNKMAEGIEEATEQKQKLAEQESFNKIASQVLHDLRSPLTTLKIAIEFFESFQSPDSNFNQTTTLLKESTERLENIAEDLLQERRERKTSSILLSEVIESLVKEFKAKDKSNSIMIQTDFDQRNTQIFGEKSDFQRAIGNIMTNAIEAMNGLGQLQLKTTSNETSIIIEIADNGPGMTPEVLEKVLRGGFTYNKTNGNGIGMTIVRDVVEKYKGELCATSFLGKGTTFQIKIPI